MGSVFADLQPSRSLFCVGHFTLEIVLSTQADWKDLLGDKNLRALRSVALPQG